MIIYSCEVKQSLYFIHLIYLKLFDIRNNSNIVINQFIINEYSRFFTRDFFKQFRKGKIIFYY